MVHVLTISGMCTRTRNQYMYQKPKVGTCTNKICTCARNNGLCIYQNNSIYQKTARLKDCMYQQQKLVRTKRRKLVHIPTKLGMYQRGGCQSEVEYRIATDCSGDIY